MSGIQLLFIGGGGGRRVINLSIAAPAYNYDVFTNRGPTYVAGNSDITVTVSPGVTVGSTSTGSYAFLVPSSFSPTDTVTVINQGVIQGRGGNGGGGSPGGVQGTGQGSPGQTGGNAVFVNRPTTITNNGTLAGGGGGGGGGSGVSPENDGGLIAGGGGGGGGAGFDGGTGGAGGVAPGTPQFTAPPGSNGTSPAGGAGGPGRTNSGATSGAGGAGGGRGASGTAGQSRTPVSPIFIGGGAGSPGAYIVGQPFVTYPAVGTRQGPSS